MALSQSFSQHIVLGVEGAGSRNVLFRCWERGAREEAQLGCEELPKALLPLLSPGVQARSASVEYQ